LEKALNVLPQTVLPSLACAALLVTAPLHAAPVILVNDTFEDGALPAQTATPGDDAFDPLDTAFSPFDNTASPNPPTLSVTDDSGVGGLGSQALLIDNNRNFTGASGSFAATTLAVGDRLDLQFTTRYLNGPAASGVGFRFGLADGPGGLGYTVTVGTGTSTGIGFFQNDAANAYPNVNGDTRITSSGGDSAGIGPNEIADISLTVTRTVSGIDLTVSYDDTATQSLVTVTDVPGSYNAFNTLLLGNGTPDNDILVDDVSVTYTPIPEPASLALVALGGLLMATRRR
jgi:hypothetical protein